MDGAPHTETIVSEQCPLIPQDRITPRQPPRPPTDLAPPRQGKGRRFELPHHGSDRFTDTAADGVGRLRAGHNSIGTCPRMSSTPWLSRDDGSVDTSRTVSAVSCRHDRQGRVTPRRAPGGRNRGASRSQPSREWIGGRLSPPFFIHDRAEPYRPDLVLWMELPDAFVVGQAVAMPEDTQGAVARTLRNALTQPAGGSPRQPRPCPRRWPRYRRRGARRRSRERYPSRSPRRRSSTISCSTVATMPASQDDEPSYFVAGRISAAEVEKLFARRCCGWTSRRSASGRPNPHPFRCLRRSPHAGTPAARW